MIETLKILTGMYVAHVAVIYFYRAFRNKDALSYKEAIQCYNPIGLYSMLILGTYMKAKIWREAHDRNRH